MRLGREFGKLWVGGMVSNLGDGVTFVAAPLLAATLTDEPMLIAGVSFAYTAPRIFSSALTGAVVDRCDRRQLIAWGNMGRAVCTAALAVCVFAGVANILLMYAVFALLGVLETASDNSAFALLPAIVREDRLDQANGRIASGQLVADEFFGPPLGGLLFSVSASLAVFFDALSFAVAGICFSLLRGNFDARVAEPSTPRAVRRDIEVGAMWLWRNRLLRRFSAMFGLVSLAYMIPFSVLVLLARERLGLSEVAYGLLLTGSALGGLAGSSVASPACRRLGRGTTVLSAVAIGGSAYLVIAVSTNVVLVAAMLALYIFHAVVWSVSVTSLRQELIPADLRGRVNGVNKTIGLLGLSSGSLIGGWLASAFGLTAPFWVAGALLLIVAVGFTPLVNNAAIRRARRPRSILAVHEIVR